MARGLRVCNAGRFNRSISIESKSEIQDAGGQPIETWAAYATAWAEKKDMTASEKFRAGQEIASRTSIFVMHWRSDLSPADHRLVCEGVTYDIEAISEIGFHEALEISATATRL